MKQNKTLYRILALLLVLVLAVGLTACGNKDKSSDTKQETNTQPENNNSEDKDSEDTGSEGDSENAKTPADTKTDSGVLAATTDVTAEDILGRGYSGQGFFREYQNQLCRYSGDRRLRLQPWQRLLFLVDGYV